MADLFTDAIEAANAERAQLRAEVDRLSKTLAAYEATDLGYDQAVREIRDHFKKRGDGEVVKEIEAIWMKGTSKTP